MIQLTLFPSEKSKKYKAHLFIVGFLVLQPVYVQDDFFDSLSCGDLDRESRNGRTRFSEQVGKDSEVFLHNCKLFIIISPQFTEFLF